MFETWMIREKKFCNIDTWLLTKRVYEWAYPINTLTNFTQCLLE